jgi:beta-N-acetylhexosaminidase
MPSKNVSTRGRPSRARRPFVVGVVGAALLGLLLPGAGSGTSMAASLLVRAQPAACTNTAELETWPLRQLANQTIAFPAEETDLSPASQAAADGYGGILLFGSSAPSGLGTDLANLRRQVPDKLGLLVMTDEEGGGVQRMANLVGSMPWAARMGATMTPAEIEALADAVGHRMAARGVNMDLAPVLDVDGRAVEPGEQDPDGFRSFSGKTSVVSADGVAFMKGMEAGGVVPVVKHFPGLGGVSENTDDGPAHTLRWTTLERVALPPFEAAIEAGAPAVMVSNASVPGFTSLPAALSSKMVQGELRRTLGFKGLIVTDSLSALAISDPPLSLSVPEASVAALRAGDDMVLFSLTATSGEDLSVAASTSDAIVAAVNAGTLLKSQLVSAVAHVLNAKNINLCVPTKGYWLVSARGNLYNFGNAGFYGSRATRPLRSAVVGVGRTLDGRGYWLVSSKGNVLNYGDAGFYGSEATKALPAPIVGLAPTPDGAGYWLVSSAGAVYNFGDAGSYGSRSGIPLRAPIVGMASTPDGGGYWLVSSRGNVFNFGDAGFFGSKATKTVSGHIVGLAPTPGGTGYWLVSSTGAVYNFGDAGSYGSIAGVSIVGMAATPDGAGYWLVSSKGSVYNLGDARFYGSEARKTVPSIVGFAPD